MKILVYKWRAYNYPDVCQAFELLGHRVIIIEQELVSYDEDPAFEARLQGELETGQYDFVFTMNYFALISNVCEKMHTPYLSWSCDNPLISMYHKSVFHPCNYIFTFDKTNYLEFLGMGVEHIYYLPLAVDTDRLDYLLQEEKDFRAFENEISFVGSLYERNSYDKLQESLPEYLKGYFDAVIQAQLNISGGNILEDMLTVEILEQLETYFKLEKSKDSFSDLGLIFSTTVLGFKTAQVQRQHALLELAKKYSVTIYTNSNTQDLLGVQYKGSLDYWSEMPKAFYASRINLNFTIPNIKSGLPLRVFDVLGAGGFLLTNFQAEIPMYFKEGEDLVCFFDEHDLIEKAGYYLAHEDERAKIARNGHDKVKRLHQYTERIGRMLSAVFGDQK